MRQMSKDSITIYVLPGDTASLRRIWASIGDAFDPPIWERYHDYDAFLEKISTHATTLVANVASHPVGSISFYANDTQTRRAYITEVLVSPAFQGRGIGAHLLEACESSAVQAGMTSIGLEVSRNNDRALKLYIKRGYVVGRMTESSYLMSKPLSDA